MTVTVVQEKDAQGKKGRIVDIGLYDEYSREKEESKCNTQVMYIREERKKELAAILRSSADRPPQEPVNRQVEADVYKGSHSVRSHLYVTLLAHL